MTHTLHYHLHEVADYINWGYLFHAWDFPFSYGSLAKVHSCETCHQAWLKGIPNDRQEQARQALRLYKDARQLLANMDFLVRTHARICLLPANSDGDDIVVWDDQGAVHRLPLLRQQHEGECKCLSDYVRPLSQNVHDQIGLFVASTDKEMEQAFPEDDYRHMLAQTLADRLAEATIEKVHELVRRQLWGYSPDERFSVEQLFAEEYRGRRPAVGYPSLPDQSFNFLLDKILGMGDIGVRLTESGAMFPHASTSGLMIAHPALKHFAIGSIATDQLADYAARRGKTIEEINKYLAANIRS